MNFFAAIGRAILGFFAEFGRYTALLLSVARYSTRIWRDRRLLIEQMAIIGSDSLPLVALVGSFTGAIAALQATNLFSKFNLIAIAKPFIGSSIATVVFTELSPVLTALVVAGRAGGAMAAQIGSMKVSEQIDALETMAIDKDRFLAAPRVYASLMMTPALVLYSYVVALAGGFLLTMFKFGFTSELFFDSVIRFFSVGDVAVGLGKAAIFGLITALVGCGAGFATTGGAEGVGASAVRAFTLSAASILVVDAIFGYLI